MSVATELNKLTTNISNAYDEISAKGGTIPQNKNTDNLATAISSISGGGGGADEYFYTNNNETQARNMIKKLPDITSSNTSLAAMCSYFSNLIEVGNITALNCTSLQNSFENCTHLQTIGTINVGNITTVERAFSNCTNLETAPLFDTSTVTKFNYTFNYCTNLKNVPVYDWSSATNLTYVFYQCSQLTDQSIDNILQSCITATSYTGTKNLRTGIGISWSITNARITACPHYAEANALGWTI